MRRSRRGIWAASARSAPAHNGDRGGKVARRPRCDGFGRGVIRQGRPYRDSHPCVNSIQHATMAVCSSSASPSSLVRILGEIVQQVKKALILLPMKRPSSVNALTAPAAAPVVSVGRMIEQTGNLRASRKGVGSGIMRLACSDSGWPLVRSTNITDPVEQKPSAAFFFANDGNRGGFLVVNMQDTSEIPAFAEPWFLAVDAHWNFTRSCRLKIWLGPPLPLSRP